MEDRTFVNFSFLSMDYLDVINSFKINQLRSLALSLGLGTSGSRANILVRIIDFCDKHGYPEQLIMEQLSKRPEEVSIKI